MRIICRKDFLPKVYLEGWNHVTATEDEYAFMQACEKRMMWWELDDGIQLTYPSDLPRRVELWGALLTYAKKYGVEVDNSFIEVYNNEAKRLKTKHGQEELLRHINFKRQVWETTQKNGCICCQYCERIGDGWFKCKYSGDELETRISEYWDPITNVMVMFHEVGVPNEHCRDYYNERIKEANDGEI